MPSPFPGMDPWLERPMLFPDVHNTLIVYLKAALHAGLPRGYAVTGANRMWVDVESRREPDVGVLGLAEPPVGGPAVATAMAAAGMLVVDSNEVLSDPIEEPYLQIVTDEDDRLVTAVEVVSLSNKRPGDRGRASYQHTQNEYRLSGVNLVEIDLLRGGPHTTAVSAAGLRAAGPHDYHVCVMLADNPGQFYVAPIRLPDRLPRLPIPLDPGATPVTVDLQAVFDRCYDEGGFARLAKYDRRQPDPPLLPQQQAWAEAILREKGVLT
ncbi:MAG: DUF4058 family protein [Gemmataceae bacterium]|nr:DUF4058 family protein [Gemmataceae bacterium]